MNTQNTPVHIKLWHRGFWMVAIANFMVALAVYIFLPIIPLWLIEGKGCSSTEAGISFFAFGLGLFLLGPFCSYLVQRYRRNLVCILSIAFMALSIAFMYWLNGKDADSIDFSLICLQRFMLGAFFGLAQMVLTSTLIVDTCESFLRTEANHCVSWFSRMSLSIGPMAGLLLYYAQGVQSVISLSLMACLTAAVLVAITKFPFRAPEESIHHFSLDRFFLTNGLILFVNLLLINISIGILFSLSLPFAFYGFMMGGFLLALLAQRFMFRNADLKSEVITALFFIIAALVLMLTKEIQKITLIVPMFIGFGIGIIGSRFLLFFIKLSRHCQRGTSQSTFMLAWESGLAIGVGVGLLLSSFGNAVSLILSLVLAILSLLIYHFHTHKWYMLHKNR